MPYFHGQNLTAEEVLGPMEMVLPVRRSGLHIQDHECLAGVSRVLRRTMLGFGPRRGQAQLASSRAVDTPHPMTARVPAADRDPTVGVIPRSPEITLTFPHSLPLL